LIAPSEEEPTVSEEDRNNTLLSVLACVGIGALVGAAAALLLAPQSGEVTRTQIRGTADDLLEKLRDTVEELRGKVDEMVTSLKARGSGNSATSSALPDASADESTATGV
jgi:gas vesicle protein